MFLVTSFPCWESLQNYKRGNDMIQLAFCRAQSGIKNGLKWDKTGGKLFLASRGVVMSARSRAVTVWGLSSRWL